MIQRLPLRSSSARPSCHPIVGSRLECVRIRCLREYWLSLFSGWDCLHEQHINMESTPIGETGKIIAFVSPQLAVARINGCLHASGWVGAPDGESIKKSCQQPTFFALTMMPCANQRNQVARRTDGGDKDNKWRGRAREKERERERRRRRRRRRGRDPFQVRSDSRNTRTD